MIPDQGYYSSPKCRPADVACIGSFVETEPEYRKGRLGHIGCMRRGHDRVRLLCGLSGVEGDL